jgi:hypothetical protein
MGPREQILKAIDKKRAERFDIEREFLQRLSLVDGHIEGLEAALKSLPKEVTPNVDATSLRENSSVAQARDFIKKEGKPVHIATLVAGIGKEPTHQNKVSIASSLSAYARRGQIFTKTAPNTFGLIGMDGAQHSQLKAGNILTAEFSEEGGDEIEFDPEEEGNVNDGVLP